MRITRHDAPHLAGVRPRRSPAVPASAGNQAADSRRRAPPTVEHGRRVRPPARTMAELNEAGTITVGTKFDQPCFGLLEPSDGKPEGFDVEIAKIIAAKLGIAAGQDRVGTRPSSANREPFIQNGKVDIVVATYTINDKRKKSVDFAGPYYIAGQDIMVRQGQPRGHQGSGRPRRQEGLLGRGLDPGRRTSGQTTPRPQLTTFDMYSKCVDALQNGQVDAVTTDNVILHRPASPAAPTRSAGRQAVHRGAVRHRPEEGRRRVPRLHQRHARGGLRGRRLGQRRGTAPPVTSPAPRPRSRRRSTGTDARPSAGGRHDRRPAQTCTPTRAPIRAG